MEIKTFIGRKLDYINGILRVHVELRKPLKKIEDLRFSYEYYNAPKNALDFIAKRYVQYPLSCYQLSKRSGDDTIFNVSYQNLADLVYFLDLKKTILTCADAYTFITRRNITYPWFVQKYWLSGFKRCRYFIAISEFTKEEMVSKLGISENRIKVIKCAINQEIFKPINEDKIQLLKPLYPDYKKILYVGTEARRKNFPTLLKAFYLIKKSYKKIKLIRIGTPKNSGLIKKLNLEKDVINISNIDNKRLNEIYNLCDLLVFPSTYEGFGLPGLEAAACGLPVICSDTQVFREIYQNFPIYFPATDYRTLARLILETIDNEAKKKTIVKNGLEVLKQYSWEKSAKLYYKYCQKVLDNL